MSHRATNWAIQQRGLEPATKILLWFLADCHNAHTGQCNPSQEKLAEDCEMSRASVNRHLAKLEDAGLIRRIRKVNEATKRQESTAYELALDGAFTSEAESQIETRKSTDPCLNLEQTRVSDSRVSVSHSCETLTSKGTRNRTGNSAGEDLFSGLPKPEAPFRGQTPAELFERFWSAYPKKAGKPAAEKNFLKAIKGGADPERIIEGARRYAKTDAVARGYAKMPQGWLTDMRWDDADLWADQAQEVDRYAAIRARAQVDQPGRGMQ